MTSRGCEVRYLWSQSVGLSRANNTGIAAAKHDALVFTHDDVLVAPSWHGALVRALVEAGPRAVVTGRVPPTTAGKPGDSSPSIRLDETPAVYEGRIGTDVLYPLNMAMHRSAIVAIGHFDERLGLGTGFPGGEDNNFGFRLLEAGYRVVSVPEAVVYHRAWMSEGEFLALRWSYGRGRGAYYAKHLSLRDPYMLKRRRHDVLKRVLRFPSRLWRDRRGAYGDAAFTLGVLSGAAEWLLTQRQKR